MTKPYRSSERSPQELSYALSGELYPAEDTSESSPVIHRRLQLPVEAFTGTIERELILRTCEGRHLRSTLELMQGTVGAARLSVDYFVDFALTHKDYLKLLRRIGRTNTAQICVIGSQQFERKGKNYYPSAWYRADCPKELPTLVKIDDIAMIGPNILCVVLYLKI